MTGNQRRRSAFSTVILIASVVLILAVVALYLILSSRLKASQQEYRLYYVSKSSGTLIRSEKRVVLGTDDAAPTPRQLINALLDGPNSAELRSPFPASLHVRSVTESDGLLYIDFSGSYAEMEPFERRLADCCLFQTVSALDGIYSVSLYANGIPLPDGQALTAAEDGDLPDRGQLKAGHAQAGAAQGELMLRLVQRFLRQMQEEAVFFYLGAEQRGACREWIVQPLVNGPGKVFRQQKGIILHMSRAVHGLPGDDAVGIAVVILHSGIVEINRVEQGLSASAAAGQDKLARKYQDEKFFHMAASVSKRGKETVKVLPRFSWLSA